MAQRTGYVCDVCDKFGYGVNGSRMPEGWYRLMLPEAIEEKADDRSRDVCSAKCLVKIGKDRGEVDGSMKLGGRSTIAMSDGLRAHLESLGKNGRAAGQLVGNHTRHHKDKGIVKDGCAVCEYLTRLRKE